MAYMEEDYRLDYYADHAWVDSPPAMLGPVLVDALRASGAFATVTEDARGITSDLRLDSLIVNLYQDFRTRPSMARLEIRVRLVDPQGRRVLASRAFADAEPAPSDDAYGGVVAANRALARMLPRIADFAAETASRAGPSEPASASPR
jgi:cholesterol transport system auxiliary component